ncbi:MAG TPA: hypothetical protein VMT59_02525 [Gaiellaceae bacterium]|nr:hypothetical protein [Gaiellaceae bacterium]
MAAWSSAARNDEAVRARPRAQSQARPRPAVKQRRVAGGIVWIVVLGVLLAGVVAMNVAVLRLNMGLDRLGRERASLIQQNDALVAQLSSAAAAPKIQALAQAKLGYVPAPSTQTTYVELGPHAK